MSGHACVTKLVVVLAVLLVCGGPALAQDAPAGGTSVIQQAAPADDTWEGVLEVVLFYIFAIAALGSGLAICVSRNIVRMAVYLFFTLGAVAVLYFLLLANFIAVIQLIVYAGGTLILLVFGVMLTSKSPWARFDTHPAEMIAAALVCLVFAVLLLTAITAVDWPQTAEVVTAPTVADIGGSLLTTYLVPFEVVSVMLLAVMIGAAFLARQE